VLFIVLVTLLLHFVKTDALVFTENFITPNKTVGCSANRSQNHCLTLQEYASRPDVYFKSDTVFYFEPGVHELNSSLKLENLNNVTLQGLSGTSSQKVIIYFETFVNVTWEKCSNIEVSSVNFYLLNNFTHVIVLNQTRKVLLHDIYVLSSDNINTVSGCSSIMCQQSEVSIFFFFFKGTTN
jgi:hypothetical protein